MDKNEEHLLDNPIWNALASGNKDLSRGTGNAKYFRRDIAFFAGLKNNSEQDFRELHLLFREKEPAVLFLPETIKIPAEWTISVEKKLLQLTGENCKIPSYKEDDILPLGEQNIGEMLRLTSLTNPGPFLDRTIEFGNYEGIFDGENLVAMAGQRLQPGKYTEISAVCSHPDHAGKGYASRIIRSQIRKIKEEGRIPFLHVLPDNSPAYKLYEKLGFTVRKELWVYVIEKSQ